MRTLLTHSHLKYLSCISIKRDLQNNFLRFSLSQKHYNILFGDSFVSFGANKSMKKYIINI